MNDCDVTPNLKTDVSCDGNPSKTRFRSHATKKFIGKIEIYKCYCCPYMTFSAKDVKLHGAMLHDSSKTSKEDNTPDIVLKCPGCVDSFFTETFFKHHLYTHHNMLARDISKLLINLKKNIEYDGGESVENSVIILEFCNDITKSNTNQVDDKLTDETCEPMIFNNDSENINSTVEDVSIPSESDRDTSISSVETASNTPVIVVPPTTDPNPIPDIVVLPNKHYKCNIQNCKVKLKSFENITYHRSCHLNNTQNINCPECKINFGSVETLHNHLWKEHGIDLELHACDHCQYKVYNLTRLNNIHMRIHSDQKNYTCSFCTKTFKNSKQLNNHNDRWHGKNSIKILCTLCKREFTTRRLLSMHMKIVHEKIKLFHCNHCDYATSLKSSLVLHLRSHTGEKPHHCTECSFKSSDRTTLKRHMMQHTPHKQYKCDNCSYSCIQAATIKSHIKMKHPGVKSNLLHSCPKCPYTTVNKANFSVHLYSHNNEQLDKKPRTKTRKPKKKLVKETKLVKNENNSNLNITKSNCNDVLVTKPNDVQVVQKESIVNNHPISVKNISDLRTNFISSDNNYTNCDDKDILHIIENKDMHQCSSKTNDTNIYIRKSDILLNNDVVIENPIVADCATFRKKPKISVKSNLILKGPNTTDSFIPQTSFGEFHNSPETFLPQHLMFGDEQVDSETQLEPISFNNNSYDSFLYSEYSDENFESEMLNPDITQYIINEQSDSPNQLSADMKGDNQNLKTDMMEVNSNDSVYLTKKFDENKYVTLIQPPIKFEDKVNTNYFNKQNNLEILPAIDELPIVFYPDTKDKGSISMENYANDTISTDETSCDNKLLMNSDQWRL